MKLRTYMKNFIVLSVSVVTMMNLATAVFAEEKEIQLTDYRYKSIEKLTDGYSVCESYERSDYSEDDIPVYSVILKPDGTELFEQGKYAVKYRTEGLENIRYIGDLGYKGFAYPKDKNYFFVHPLGDIIEFITNSHTKLTDKQIEEGYFINEYDDDWLYNKCGIVHDADENTLITLDENGKEVFEVPVGNDYSFCGIINGDVAVYGEYTHMEWFQSEPFEGVRLEKLVRLSDNKILIDNKNFTEGYLYVSTDGQSYMVDGCSYFGKYPTYVSDYYDKDGNIIDKPEGVEYKPYVYNPDYIHWSDDGQAYIETDDSYTIKSKTIGDKTYYALFKTISEGENEEDISPKEQPSDLSSENIKKATADGLLYNNSNCRYEDAITRNDFCILAVEAYCKLQGMDIDEYIKNNNITLDYNKFKDTDNVYVLLADKLGIMNGTEENTFSPTEYMTRQQAAVVINNIANLTGLKPNAPKVNFIDTKYYASWAKDAIFNVTSINNIKGTPIMQWVEPNKFSPWMYYTRQQAYTDVYTIYEMCK